MADPPPLMHATQVAQPFHIKGWVYEEKEVEKGGLVAWHYAGGTMLGPMLGNIDEGASNRHLVS
jgi:hypothetical protein